jgi:hypothetical protein
LSLDLLTHFSQGVLVEYDRESEMIVLSPTGIARVEDTILKPGANGLKITVPVKKPSRK